ncbi:actin-related protein 9, partial [Lecanoromycetidae sp. Uapishka_2]
MPPFKDEHVLIISPGSQTTLAQLGLPESFAPARVRIPTRMFPAEKKGEWEPMKVRERKVTKSSTSNGASGYGNGDVTMDDGQAGAEGHEEEVLFEEDPSSEEGAVYPLQNGRVVNWSCFFALLTHIYNTLSPPFHTPILVVSQPAWTAQDHESLTQFFFEKFKTPAFCLMDSALAVCYAYGKPTATVIDVGHGKCDVSTVEEFVVSDLGRGSALEGCGGEAMTLRLLGLLGKKGFTRDMCEQLKKNSICEILPPGAELPIEFEAMNPASAVSTGVTGSGDGQRGSIAAQGGAPRGPGPNTDVGDADEEREFKDGEDDEGVLDVATIVASGRTSEFLARKDKEKAEKAAARKKDAADAAAANRERALPNSKRAKVIFHYHERRPLEDLNANGKRAVDGTSGQDGSEPKRQKTPEPGAENDVQAVDSGAAARKEERKEERRRNREGTAFVRKTIDVGPERLQAASGGILDQIADAVHRCIGAYPEVSKRSNLWDSLVIVGNGSKVKGFKESLIATINARYLISPSSATIFSSELPSNFTTPVATGANTPQPQHHAQHHGAGVNPLLLAATTASNANLAPPGQPQQQLHQQLQQQQLYQQQQMQSHQHSGHAQTPTSIKSLKVPEYFTEWKDFGMEEASFLGAQVAAKVVFVVDQGLSKGFMSRTEYNDLGPQGIHESCL